MCVQWEHEQPQMREVWGSQRAYVQYRKIKGSGCAYRRVGLVAPQKLARGTLRPTRGPWVWGVGHGQQTRASKTFLFVGTDSSKLLPPSLKLATLRTNLNAVFAGTESPRPATTLPVDDTLPGRGQSARPSRPIHLRLDLKQRRRPRHQCRAGSPSGALCR